MEIKKDEPKAIIVRISLAFAMLAIIFAIVLDIIYYRPFQYIFVELNVFIILIVINYYRNKWIENEKWILFFTCLFSFFALPFVWLISIGVSGSMPYYTFFLIVITMFILERKKALIISLGIIVEVAVLYLIELFYPNLFISTYDRTTSFIRLILSYATVSILIVGILYSIKKHIKAVQDEFYLLSITDELTKVYNRRHIIDILSKTINLSERENVEFSILFIDINKFKQINDIYGHDFGDKILIELGFIINLLLRNYDVCGRYGGDEFLVVLPYTDKDQSVIISERISKSFSLRILEILSIDISLSIGITQGNGKKLEEIIKDADDKMYASKKAFYYQEHPLNKI